MYTDDSFMCNVSQNEKESTLNFVDLTSEWLFEGRSNNLSQLCFIGNDSICRVDCNDKYVSAGIGDDYKLWTPETPVFIDAQTGSGKNHFTENVLVPHIREQNFRNNTNHRILILSNRIALRKQVKNRIESSGVAVVKSYQSLSEFLEFRKNLKKFTYIICDECHFFTSDAMFNPHTAEILRSIINNFAEHAVRIYMSSTMDDCLQYILKYEKAAHGKIGCPQTCALEPILYSFKRDYSYLDIKYFTEFSELYEIIARSIEDGEKWLLFIDSRKHCKQLKEELLDYCGGLESKDIMVISADSKGEDIYEDTLYSEKLQCKILISTSVIDNGVNIKDSKLRNIVICSPDKDKCLQMLGRKRVEDGERINLYLKQFNKSYIEDKIISLEQQRDAYHLYSLAYKNDYTTQNTAYDIKNAKQKFHDKYFGSDEDDFKGARHWFFWKTDRFSIFDPPLYPNEIAVDMVDNILLLRYKQILQRMYETGSGQDLLAEQLSWFGQGYSSCNDITCCGVKQAKEEFDKYLESLSGRKIPKEWQSAFGLEFFQKYNAAYGFRAADNKSRTPKDGYGRKIINDILAEVNVGMQLKSSSDGWEVVKI